MFGIIRRKLFATKVGFSRAAETDPVFYITESVNELNKLYFEVKWKIRTFQFL